LTQLTLRLVQRQVCTTRTMGSPQFELTANDASRGSGAAHDRLSNHKRVPLAPVQGGDELNNAKTIVQV